MTAAVLAHAGTVGWAIAGMFLFITAFALMTARTFAMNRAERDRLARLPLDQEDGDA